MRGITFYYGAASVTLKMVGISPKMSNAMPTFLGNILCVEQVCYIQTIALRQAVAGRESSDIGRPQ